MQRVLSQKLWTEIHAAAQKAQARKAAIAYVTQDLIGFRNGDVLVVDASDRAIGCGETDAPLLRKLKNDGVLLYSCGDLHAKVLLLGEMAVISSGNMSNSSSRLVEAAVLTNHPSIVSGIASFIQQLVDQCHELSPNDIEALCRIPVRRAVRNGQSRGKKPKTKISKFENRTWLVGTCELFRDPSLRETKLIDKALAQLEAQTGKSKEELDHIRFGKTAGRFVRECREGDSIIQIHRPRGAKRPNAVFKAVPVLRKQRTKHWTRFYISPHLGDAPELGWGEFKKLLRSTGYKKDIAAKMVRELDSGIADALNNGWK